MLDAFPREFQSTISAFHAAGHNVFIITGVEVTPVTQEDIDQKREYLTSLGISSDLYDSLIVCPEPHPENKAKAIQDNKIAMLFDNSKGNIKAAAPYCAALLLWNAKTD